MITPRYAQLMARYGHWQNESLLAAAEALRPAARAQDRGAFFGSIDATFRHLLWGDQIWLHRFGGGSKPEATSIAASTRHPAEWSAFQAARRETDARIRAWADALTPEALDGQMRWMSAAVGREVSRPTALLVTHFFNHQTHHRGQIHAMLTAAGAAPEDTDLFVTPGIETLDL